MEIVFARTVGLKFLIKEECLVILWLVLWLVLNVGQGWLENDSIGSQWKRWDGKNHCSS